MSAKYTRIPMECDSGIDERVGFDFSSPHLYENNEDLEWKYKSVYSYSNQRKVTQIVAPEQHRVCQSVCQKLSHLVITVCCIILLVVSFPVTVWFSIKKASLYERLVVFRLGRLQGTKGPGLVFVLPCIDRWHRVDTRMKAFKVPPKQVVTADAGIIQIGADVYYRVALPERAVTNVQNMDRAMRILVETSMQNQLVHKTLAEIESQRTTTGESIKETSNKSSLDWGVELFRVDLSETRVLRQPPKRSAPHMVFPPGLLGAMGGGANPAVPAALQQVISTAMQASSSSSAQDVAGPRGQPMLPDATDFTEWESSEFEELEPAPMEKRTLSSSQVLQDEGPTTEEMMQLVRCVLSETLVQKVRAVYYFDIIGSGGGQYYLDLKNGSGAMARGLPPFPINYDVRFNIPLHHMQSIFFGKKMMDLYRQANVHIFGSMSVACQLDVFLDHLQGFLFKDGTPGNGIPALVALRDINKYQKLAKKPLPFIPSHAQIPQPKIKMSLLRKCRDGCTNEEMLSEDCVTVNFTAGAPDQVFVDVRTEEGESIMGSSPCYLAECQRSSKPQCCRKKATIINIRKSKPEEQDDVELTMSCSYNSSSQMQNSNAQSDSVDFRGKEDDLELQGTHGIRLKNDVSGHPDLVALSAPTQRFSSPFSNAFDSRDLHAASNAVVERSRLRYSMFQREEERTDIGDCCCSHGNIKKMAARPMQENVERNLASGKCEGCREIGTFWEPRVHSETLTDPSCEDDDVPCPGNIPKEMYSLETCNSTDSTDSCILLQAAYLDSKLLSSDTSVGDGQSKDPLTSCHSLSSHYSGYPLQSLPQHHRSFIHRSKSGLSLPSLKSLA